MLLYITEAQIHFVALRSRPREAPLSRSSVDLQWDTAPTEDLWQCQKIVSLPSLGRMTLEANVCRPGMLRSTLKSAGRSLCLPHTQTDLVQDVHGVKAEKSSCRCTVGTGSDHRAGRKTDSSAMFYPDGNPDHSCPWPSCSQGRRRGECDEVDDISQATLYCCGLKQDSAKMHWAIGATSSVLGGGDERD